VATEAQIAEMEAVLREALDRGAVAVGLGTAYTPGATMAEVERVFRVAAEAGASAHIHMRNGVAGLDSTIQAAASAGAKLHVVHVNSSGDTSLVAFLDRIQTARDGGQDVTTETYPYGAGMTELRSALFDDWETWPDERFALHQLVSTGERMTRETFAAARNSPDAGNLTVIIHGRSEEQTRAAVLSPLTMIASDGFIEGGQGHPRTSGSYSKVLGRYVREEGALTLMDAPRGTGAGHGRQGAGQGRRRRGPHHLRPGHGDRPLDLRGRHDSRPGDSVRGRGRRGGGRRRTGDGGAAGTCDPGAGAGAVARSLKERRE
jgi:N-acyl-D-aspartate/D-glutamate deacylase